MKQVQFSAGSLRKKCYNERRGKQGEAEVAASKWRALIEQKVFLREVMGSSSVGTIPAWSVGMIHIQKSVDHIDLGRCRKCEAIRNGRQVATRDAVQGGVRTCCVTAITCASQVCHCAKRTMRRSQAAGKFLGTNFWKWQD